MMKRANRLTSSIRKVARGLALGTAFLLTAIFAVSAQAQTDLDGSDLIVTGAGPWNLSYTNSNNSSQSIVAVYDLANGTRYTYTGAFTGNLFIDITHQGYANNDNRFTLSNIGNDIQGGIEMHNGILFVTNTNQAVSFTGGLTLDNAVLMAFGDYNNTLKIRDGSFGGLRASGGGLQQIGTVTGNGDLVIVTDTNPVTLSGANTYTGVTSIGTVKGGGNTVAYLVLGADNTLPSTTVVEIGKSQNATYNNLPATASLDLKGTTQTIAGLHGSSIATITNSSEDAGANVTINLETGKSYDYAGSIAGKSAALLTNLTITGEGNQTLGGNVTNASITSSTTGTLTLGGNTVSLASLNVTDGTLALTPNVNMTVSGKVSLPESAGGLLDLNGANLTYTSKASADINNVDITNTNTETQSVLTFAPSADVSVTYSKKVSGNTRLVIKLPTNQNNGDRFVIGNTGNDFTGGLLIEQGTIRVDDYGVLGTSKQIDMKNGSLMTKLAFDDYTINLVGDVSKNERGAIRMSGANVTTFSGKITGVGSLEIVNDNACTLTNTGNDYQGKTYIGNQGWRKGSGQDLTNSATLVLGNSGVLPDTTVVVFGYDGSNNVADAPSGAQTLNLNGHDETVAGLTDFLGKGVITSSTDATLTVKAEADYRYAGAVKDSATVDKQGNGTLTVLGNNTGKFVVSEGTLVLSGDNSGAKGVTVAENATLVAAGENAVATQIDLAGGTLKAYASSQLDNATIPATAGDSVIALPVGGYSRELFTGTYNNMSDFTKPEYITNMDPIANTAYVPTNNKASFTIDIWGNPDADENNTNLLRTTVVNTTDEPITLEFAYTFRNDGYLAITDPDGNQTVVLDWSSETPTSAPVSKTGTFTFEPGVGYTVETRLTRFNKTIGAHAGGVNGAAGTLVGMGARVSGTDGEYLPLNFDGNNWTFADGSFTVYSDDVHFSAPVTINEGASLAFDTQNFDFANSAAFSGAGTLKVNPNEGVTHTYSGTLGDSIALVKTGAGTMEVTGTNTYTGGTTISEGVLKLIGDAVAANGPTTIEANGTLEYNVPEQTKSLTFDDTNKVTGAGQVTKTGAGTLQVEAAEGAMEVSDFTVSEGRLDMGGHLTGDLIIGDGAEFSPGVSVGSLDITGGFILGEADGTGARMIVEISGSDIDQNDQLIASGELLLHEGSLIYLELAEDCGLNPGDSFEVVFSGENSYNFDDFIETFVEAREFMNLQYKELRTGLWGITGTFGAEIPSVPEPTTWLMLLLGSLGLMFWRKRK